MSEAVNPAWSEFLRWLPGEVVWGQVLISRAGNGFTIRHAEDRKARNLRPLQPDDLRGISNYNRAGQFRPLKTQPDLDRGWQVTCRNGNDLQLSLRYLYPHSVIDWYTVRNSTEPPVTNYREFTNRQTGMYRITQLLSDEQAAGVIRAGCGPKNCLKRRLWTVASRDIDPPDAKSLIPCLEPCAVLLEFARKAMRIEQEPAAAVQMKRTDLETISAALENVAQVASVGEFSAGLNPRRVQLVLEKLRATMKDSPDEPHD